MKLLKKELRDTIGLDRMTKTPLISIAMTCYNHSHFIRDAIESVVKQIYTNWELIIINDCSIDAFRSVIEKCIKEFRIEDKTKVFNHLTNRGYGFSLRQAIQESLGELVVILDSDDAIATINALAIVADVHRKNPEVALTYSKFNQCDEKLKKVKTWRTRQLRRGETFLMCRIIISHLKVIKKRYYNMTEGINPKLKQTVDKDLILKLEEVGKLLFIDEILLNYRFHANNISRTIRQKGRDYTEFVRKMRLQIYADARKRRGIK